MLNISENNLSSKIFKEKFKNLRAVESWKSNKKMIRLLLVIFLSVLIFLFLPWTQNIRSNGYVTTLKPNQRFQSIHTIIPGRIERWYVQEGDDVKKGDTIIYISETKDEYFDPELLSRIKMQVDAKVASVNSYQEKIKALNNQINAIAEINKLKLSQTKNKIEQAKLKLVSDSIDFVVAKQNYEIASNQYERMIQLQEEGLKSLTDLESKRNSLQKANGSKVLYESKFLSAKNEILNLIIELRSINASYRDDLAKAESNKFSAESNMYEAEATTVKLKNQLTNYSVRSKMNYITAPQDGYITQTIQSGIGETVKEGQEIATIMPKLYDFAIEMYVKPIDIPLIQIGEKVVTQFDGWPAIVFSGWPDLNYGTYSGKVYAIDNYINQDGYYRVLVAPDASLGFWPKGLRVGSATSSMLLLNDVPIWYELWRKVNGFPPDYYIKSKNNSISKNS